LGAIEAMPSGLNFLSSTTLEMIRTSFCLRTVVLYWGTANLSNEKGLLDIFSWHFLALGQAGVGISAAWPLQDSTWTFGGAEGANWTRRVVQFRWFTWSRVLRLCGILNEAARISRKYFLIPP